MPATLPEAAEITGARGGDATRGGAARGGRRRAAWRARTAAGSWQPRAPRPAASADRHDRARPGGAGPDLGRGRGPDLASATISASTWRAVGQPLPEPGTQRARHRGRPGRDHPGRDHRDAACTAAWTAVRPGRSRRATCRFTSRPGRWCATRAMRAPSMPVYSLMPYAEVWRTALEGSNLLARADPVSLAGGRRFRAAADDRRRRCWSAGSRAGARPEPHRAARRHDAGFCAHRLLSRRWA